MLRIRRTETREDLIESGDRSVVLVTRVWFAWLETPWFGWGTSYRRPTRVETTGPNPESRSIRDHVMLAKLATILVLITVTLTRRIRK
jgi:hypothetical protein